MPSMETVEDKVPLRIGKTRDGVASRRLPWKIKFS